MFCTAVKYDDDANWLQLKSVSLGAGTIAALSAIVNEEEKKKICQSLRSCLIATVSYIQRRLPLSNPVIRDMQCLHPMMRKSERGKAAINRLCIYLTKVTKNDSFIDQVNAE